ncbi:translation repressor protein [Escherichia phage vb_EcoM-VR5]|uniref:Translation repressor protein n=6 Tax=Caudoviricetes TaxID=2731619 RepID=C4MZE3_9CAUD|nr:translation repressor [Escherichia phage JS98]YP_002922397.1 translation repressor [Escherichia phage JS10]YP_009205744.1 translation repressor [Escherichia phage vb_EcoM-VR5]YP_010094371.1 translation repressor [Enterobacteria phage vB_EcoM_IME281]QAY00078.1 translational repressor protein [Escherichia phage EcWhh-1]QBP35663.1 endoribonuclease translational repressor of early genes [Phage NC-G]QHR70753.1 translational repressor protein [Escherichia phage dhaeg]QHR72455.1 translational re
MIEITLKQPEDFLKVKETLTRMGIANNKEKKLYQSCHILQKQGRYYIVHFKEMLRMDGRQVDIDGEDYQRRDSIAQLLKDWGLIDIVDDSELFEITNNFRVISFKQKNDWELLSKYTIGN